MASSHGSSSSGGFSCPCQRIPLSLSSATSAEYGDIASLARRVKSGAASAAAVAAASSFSTSTRRKNNDGGGGDGTKGGGNKIGNSSSIPSGISNGGITPLHLAAQHGHPAAVSLLLKEGGCDVDTGLPIIATDRNVVGGAGATPLHRAAFSGAISSMQILLSWGESENDGQRQVNLLAKDLSFGDRKTPLHKAIAGGRPLAVQLLINALRERNLLQKSLNTRDASGLTPLELATQFTSMNADDLEQEKQSVRRWDVVAGGNAADWDTCLRLLEGATPIRPGSEDALLPERRDTQQSTSSGKALPNLNAFGNVAESYCDDMDDCQDGKCRTAIWENAFRMALASSMEMSLNNHAKSTKITVMAANRDDGGTCLPCPPAQTAPQSLVGDATVNEPKSTSTQKQKATDAKNVQMATAPKMGRQCDSCGKHSPALFRSTNHQLVCKQCRRLARR